MTVRRILTISKHEKILRTKSEPATKINREIKALIQDLHDTFNDNPAIGLAAPQIGVLKRVIAVGLGYHNERPDDEPLQPTIMINPEIMSRSEPERGYDACLSMPNLLGYTDRDLKLHVRYIDEHGKRHDSDFSGMDARVIQHEVDHLDGVLFTDRLNSLDDLFVLVPDEDGKREPVPYTEIVKKATQGATGTASDMPAGFPGLPGRPRT